MCHRSGTIYHPTETRYIFVQILIFPTLSVSKPADARMCVTCLFLLWSPSLSVCLGYATFHEMVASKDKQREYETFILPALMNNNISVLMLLYVIFAYCMAAYTIAMAAVPYVAKTWLQKKELVIAVILFKLSLMCMNLAILTTMMLMKKMTIGRLGLNFSKKK